MKVFRLVCIALVGLAMTSCGLFNNNNPEYKLSDLQGLWQENNTEHFVRFTTEQSDEAGYLYGREWHEDEDVFESDLKPYGNGWFKYLFETSGNLTEIHLMDNGGAEVPKVYVVSSLTSDKLEYYEKDRTSNKFSFSKVVETK